MHITVVQLLAVKLLPSKLVHNVAIAALDEPSKTIDASSLLVNIEALLGLQQLGDSSASSLIVLELEVAHQVMRVEVELLEAEGCGNLTLVIHLFGTEQLRLGVVLQNVTIGGIL